MKAQPSWLPVAVRCTSAVDVQKFWLHYGGCGPLKWVSGWDWGEQSFQAATRQNAITNIQFATLPQIVWRTAANAVPLVACGNLFDLRTVNLAGSSTIF